MYRVFSVILLLAFTAVAARSEDAPARDEKVVTVKTLTLTHTSNLSTEELNFVIREIKRHKYDSTDLDEIAERIRCAIQVRGYFKALVGDPVFRVVATDQHTEIVDVMVAIEEGQIYRLAKISFSGTSVFTPAKLRREFPIADGDTFNGAEIGDGLENLRVLAGKKGYVNFSAVPQTTIDEATDTISLLIDLDAGTAFHLGKLTVRGEESVLGARDKLLKTWKNYEGQVYDPGLLTRFLHDLNARRSVRPEQVFETHQDPQGTINVQITLVKPYTMAFSNK